MLVESVKRVKDKAGLRLDDPPYPSETFTLRKPTPTANNHVDVH
jgi:hypothetical protein